MIPGNEKISIIIKEIRIRIKLGHLPLREIAFEGLIENRREKIKRRN